ncbi:hypothetical protein FLAVO9AF_220032 [Flavobacterium sp. 9AF]|uniref:hypothetical protein n=1 Tax=Flavobacterium sp. 9AF TaxID=2653142 RepID=UPI0012F2CD0D|nr:hypothetical protein [Flavobacterium sp. 9AF]VXB60027.1 hypothetical protein FLAVO9AF_220032 [Flavobacterium sp. 9AF]
MKNQIIILFTFFILTVSCKTGVEVTFTNQSEEDFERLTVGIFEKRFDFENLKNGQTTQPIKVEQIYPYCYAKAVTQNDTIRFIPIDYIGEKLRKQGKLNLKIYIDSTSNKKRQLNFITERN